MKITILLTKLLDRIRGSKKQQEEPHLNVLAFMKDGFIVLFASHNGAIWGEPLEKLYERDLSFGC